MILKKQKKILNLTSIATQEILVTRLNRICNFLDIEYNINSGGCCYLAYCIAKLLNQDNIKFNVVVYDNYELVNKFNDISDGHYHYAIQIGTCIINPSECLHEEFYKNVYYNVKVSEILNHYKKSNWNNCYNSKRNKFIFNILKNFYDDFTEDLREI